MSASLNQRTFTKATVYVSFVQADITPSQRRPFLAAAALLSYG